MTRPLEIRRRSGRIAHAPHAKQIEFDRADALGAQIADYLRAHGPTPKSVIRDSLCIASEQRYELALRRMPVRRTQLGGDPLISLHVWGATP